MLRNLTIPLAVLFGIIAVISIPLGLNEWSSEKEVRNWKEFSSQHDCERLFNVTATERRVPINLYFCDNKFYYIR